MILALLACGGADPDLVAQRESLDAWRRGAEAMERREPDVALEAFRTARSKRPDDVILGAWMARAQAESGDPQGAQETLEGVLKAAPGFSEARYNRAALLARLGDVDGAGRELSRALAEGGLNPRDAMRDPDFAPHLGAPAFDFLPEDMLMVAVDAPREAVFWGSEASVRFRVVGADGAPVTLAPAASSGPVELVSVIEDIGESTEGRIRDLTFTFKVVGAGEVVLGPVLVRSGEWEKTVAEIRFPTSAPPGREGTGEPLTLSLPTQLRGDLQIPGARRTAEGVHVVAEPNDRVRITPQPSGKPVRYELRDRSRTQWVLRRYDAPVGAAVLVERGGVAVLETSL